MSTNNIISNYMYCLTIYHPFHGMANQYLAPMFGG